MDHCSRDLYYRPVLTRGLTGAYRKSADVINQAGLKMKDSSDQIRFVAGMANETARNVGSVAAACEKLTVTSNEISRAVGKQVLATAEITRSITDISKNTDLISQRIGGVGRAGLRGAGEREARADALHGHRARS